MDHIDSQLIDVCLAHGAVLDGKLSHGGQRVHGGRLLLTIAGLESSFGEQRLFVRYEPAYAPGGRYHNSDVQKMWKIYGCLAASSFGTFQLMLPTARELGYTGHPIDLQKDSICAYWATQLILKRFIQTQGATTLEQVLDAYNSGTFRDSNVPAYVDKGVHLYANLDSV